MHRSNGQTRHGSRLPRALRLLAALNEARLNGDHDLSASLAQELDAHDLSNGYNRANWRLLEMSRSEREMLRSRSNAARRDPKTGMYVPDEAPNGS